MSNIYRNSILRKPEVSFDFETSTITKDNLDECIQKISRELFSQRPATEPYVRAFIMFGSFKDQKNPKQLKCNVMAVLDELFTTKSHFTTRT